jgi:putative nucleotidyltransferase with HDIG domain
MAVADHGAAVLEQVADVEAAGAEQQLAAVLLLAESLDLRDTGTARHSLTVGELARATALELGLAAERVERIRVAGVLHDLGKLAVPDAILHKPGRLDDAEWREMRRHPEVGARILAHAGLHDIAAWVHAHHERVDGRGYPLELAADDIALEAKILAVADAYEAMIADRPYRAGMDPLAAQDELRECAGTQFDPAVVDAFLRTRAAVALA